MSGATTIPIQKTDGVSQASSRLALLWLAGVVDDDVVPLTGARLCLGRDTGCDVQLAGPGVSRRHAEIYRQGPVFAVRDLGSTNGTFINGSRSDHDVLAPNRVLRIGDCLALVVEVAGDRTPGRATFRELAPGLYGGLLMGERLDRVRKASTSDLPIMIVGETGSGKDRVARAIHGWSRRSGAFQAINCAALPESLAEAELFGHRKGAFTGAERASLGHFRAADGGTLFLDEVLDLPLSIQAKLLRVLEEKTVTPLGETTPIPVDVRVVAACQRGLEQRMAESKFRVDLHARLAGLTVDVPPLRERREDIVYLFEHFLHSYSGGRPPSVEAKLLESLCLHDFKTNVRELELLARQLLAVCGSEPVLKREFLPPNFATPSTDAAADAAPIQFHERRDHDLHRLVKALRTLEGNVKAAAASLGISRQRAYRIMAGRSVEELLSSSDSEPAVGGTDE